MTPAKLITALRKTDPYIKDIFMSGGCYKFHLFLKAIFPVSMPYINRSKDHIITRIGGRFYDITGEYKQYSNYIPMTKEDVKMAKKWSFYKQCMLQITECPICEEPIIYNQEK